MRNGNRLVDIPLILLLGVLLVQPSTQKPWPFRSRFSVVARTLDNLELSFEARDKSLFFFNLILGLFD